MPHALESSRPRVLTSDDDRLVEVAFLDAATWLAQIVMFVLLGLLVSPHRLGSSIGPAVVVAED